MFLKFQTMVSFKFYNVDDKSRSFKYLVVFCYSGRTSNEREISSRGTVF